MSAPVPAGAVRAACAAGCLGFVLVLLVRGGPIAAQNDALAVTLPTTAVSHGDLRRADQQTLVPDPPGYPVLAAAVVTALRPWIGSPTWCSDRHVPAGLAGEESAYFSSLLHPCGAQHAGRHGALPPWYRSQAVLAVGAWLALLAGVEMLLRAVYGRPAMGEVAAALALALLPAASDAVIESFHPQDLVSVGLTCAALAQALRRRWLATGALLAGAALDKQFALLAVPAVVLAAPGWRARGAVVGAFAAVAVAVLVPFWLADPAATWQALSGTSAEGAGIIRSATAVGLLGIGEHVKLEVARDGPVVLAALASVVVWWRGRRRLAEPAALVGMVLACMATRLLLEVSVYGYYLLAVAVLLLVLDLVRGRLPLLAFVWVVVTRFGILGAAAHAAAGWVASALVVAAAAPMLLGTASASTGRRRAGPEPVAAAAS